MMMTYVEGFILAVPIHKKEDFRKHAADAAPLFKEFGVTRHVETWGDDVPDGTVTDFRKAVQAKEGEEVVFSWIEWPSKALRDQSWAKLMADERMKPDGEHPFDGKRMFWGGFEPILDTTRL
jgi:uncharacterized protein YbaA (DUF1428 family)